MSDPLYRKELLRLAADAHGAGRLAQPKATGRAHNPTCGDKVTVYLVIELGRVSQIAQEAKACVLTQASASILGQNLRGATREDVEALHRRLSAMLEAVGPPPDAPFEAFGAFDAAIAYPGRHRCVLLPVDAVLAAFDASEASEPKTMGPER